MLKSCGLLACHISSNRVMASLLVSKCGILNLLLQVTPMDMQLHIRGLLLLLLPSVSDRSCPFHHYIHYNSGLVVTPTYHVTLQNEKCNENDYKTIQLLV